MINIKNIREILTTNGLRVTPQRIAVLGAVMTMNNHPTADHIIEYIQKNHPNIAVGTVYKILETFVNKKIIRKVKTDKDIMRYDAIKDNHHHLYCTESELIEDYFDDKLDNLLEDYFAKKNIPNFKIKDINLQIIGKFVNQNKKAARKAKHG
jgi:Fur family peroxide stress response transcriptional regulator